MNRKPWSLTAGFLAAALTVVGAGSASAQSDSHEGQANQARTTASASVAAGQFSSASGLEQVPETETHELHTSRKNLKALDWIAEELPGWAGKDVILVTPSDLKKFKGNTPEEKLEAYIGSLSGAAFWDDWPEDVDKTGFLEFMMGAMDRMTQDNGVGMYSFTAYTGGGREFGFIFSSSLPIDKAQIASALTHLPPEAFSRFVQGREANGKILPGTNKEWTAVILMHEAGHIDHEHVNGGVPSLDHEKESDDHAVTLALRERRINAPSILAALRDLRAIGAIRATTLASDGDRPLLDRLAYTTGDSFYRAGVKLLDSELYEPREGIENDDLEAFRLGKIINTFIGHAEDPYNPDLGYYDIAEALSWSAGYWDKSRADGSFSRYLDVCSALEVKGRDIAFRNPTRHFAHIQALLESGILESLVDPRIVEQFEAAFKARMPGDILRTEMVFASRESAEEALEELNLQDTFRAEERVLLAAQSRGDQAPSAVGSSEETPSSAPAVYAQTKTPTIPAVEPPGHDQ